MPVMDKIGKRKLPIRQCVVAAGLAFLLVLCGHRAFSRVRSNAGFVNLAKALVNDLSINDLARAVVEAEGTHPLETNVAGARADFQSAIYLDCRNGSAGLGLIIVSLLDKCVDAPTVITDCRFEANQGASEVAALWSGFCLYAEGHEGEAIQVWQAGRAGTYFRNLGVWLLRQGAVKCLEAGGLLELAVRIDPDDPDAAFELGNALSCLGQNESAVDAYRQAAALYPPNSARHFLALGDAAYLSQEWLHALEAYNRVIGLPSVDQPDLLSAYQGVDRACGEGMGDWECAASAVRATFSLLPDDPWPYWRMGEIASARGDTADAARWYQEALSLPGRQAEATRRLARFWVSVGEQALHDQRWQDAQQAYSRAVEMCPEMADAYVGLGRVAFWGRGDLVEAEHYLATAMQIDPQNDDAPIWLARLYRENAEAPQVSRSLDLLRSVTQRSPNNAEGWAQTGLTFYAIGDFEQAILSLEKAVSLTAHIPWYHLALGDAYREAGQPEAAIRAYSQALNVAPGWSEPAERIHALQTLANE